MLSIQCLHVKRVHIYIFRSGTLGTRPAPFKVFKERNRFNELENLFSEKKYSSKARAFKRPTLRVEKFSVQYKNY